MKNETAATAQKFLRAAKINKKDFWSDPYVTSDIANTLLVLNGFRSACLLEADVYGVAPGCPLTPKILRKLIIYLRSRRCAEAFPDLKFFEGGNYPGEPLPLILVNTHSMTVENARDLYFSYECEKLGALFGYEHCMTADETCGYLNEIYLRSKSNPASSTVIHSYGVCSDPPETVSAAFVSKATKWASYFANINSDLDVLWVTQHDANKSKNTDAS